MTTPSQKTPFRKPEETAQTLLAKAIARARLVMAWERIWPLLVRVGVVLAAFLAVSWAGLWLHLPTFGRIIGVALFGLLLLLAARPFFLLRWPGAEEAIARLDAKSGLAHRPATAISDSLATRPEDAVGAALWRAHLSRAKAAARDLHAGTPAPGLARKDPRAFRALALLAVVATFFIASGDRMGRVGAAFDWRSITPSSPYRLDAWIDPPGYTGRPPQVLPGLRSDDDNTLNASAPQVPSGSTLVVRAAGIDIAALKVSGGITEDKPA